uniref:Protein DETOXIFICATION n=1 Tax=Aegilops tauschii TaxID=37682 RepID=M8BI26_AEGTA
MAAWRGVKLGVQARRHATPDSSPGAHDRERRTCLGETQALELVVEEEVSEPRPYDVRGWIAEVHHVEESSRDREEQPLDDACVDGQPLVVIFHVADVDAPIKMIDEAVGAEEQREVGVSCVIGGGVELENDGNVILDGEVVEAFRGEDEDGGGACIREGGRRANHDDGWVQRRLWAEAAAADILMYYFLGTGSALETLCGQAVGAGQLHTLGVYMQRSWIICLATAVALLLVYMFTDPILRLLRQSPEISTVAGRYARWCVRQLFAYAVNFPMQKFYQAQSRVWVMTVISGAAVGVHALLNWVVVAKLGRGLLGAAMVGNASWWLINAVQFVYVVGGSFPEAGTGFSRKAFASLGGFVRLSLASAVMLCLEMWYYTAVIILVGCLKNPEIQVGAVSICTNYNIWTLMVSVGFNAARSRGERTWRQAPESGQVLGRGGGGHGGFGLVTLLARKQLPRLFTDEGRVVKEAARLGYLLAATIGLNSIQPVLSGVAIGAGWQSLVAWVNIGCYYLIGLPLAAVFGFKLKLNATGIWVGMLIGTVLQTVILFVILFRTKWQKEAMLAEERVRNWGGNVELPTVQEAR